MNLKIERVEVFCIQMPQVATFVGSNVTKSVVVRFTASDGSIGVSSIEFLVAKPPNTAPEIAALLQGEVAKDVLGQDPMNVNRFGDVLDKHLSDRPMARAAFEMACVDLACRSLGVPLHTYLGGAVKSEVHFNAWIGQVSPEEAAAEAVHWWNAGFRSAKIKIGGGLEADRDRIAAVREAVGRGMDLRIDANLQYDADTSLKLCKLVQKYDLQLFEQPARRKDLAGLARVRREGGIPVMADESVSDHKSLIAVIKADAADYVKFGIKQVGGILRAARMIATAEAAGIPVVIGHGFGLDPSTLAEIMLAATSRNVISGLECVGPLKMKDTIATGRLDISSGRLVLPSLPGLGITLDDKKLEQYRLI
jgi:muconate cycloisomerase